MVLRPSYKILPGHLRCMKLEQKYGKTSSQSKIERFLPDLWEDVVSQKFNGIGYATKGQ